MTTKTKLTILVVLFLLVLLFILIVSFSSFGGFNFFISVPKPEIQYGEFPCRLTYEINGETIVVEDIVICEFEGTDFQNEAGIYRKWKTYLKSGNEEMTLLDLRGLNEKDEFGNTILELFFSYGNAEYFMGDTQRVSIPQIEDYIEYKYITDNGIIGGNAFKSDKAFEKYKIRLISWECTPPIENVFK